MNVTLWFLQILLAVHTAVGAIWKSSNSEHVMPSLAGIPHGVWVGLTVPELLCAIALIAPAIDKRLAVAVPIAAACIAVEMFFFAGVHLASGAGSIGPVVYWLVVAGIGTFVVYGRLVLAPIRRSTFA